MWSLVSRSTWVLGIELGSSARAVSDLGGKLSLQPLEQLYVIPKIHASSPCLPTSLSCLGHVIIHQGQRLGREGARLGIVYIPVCSAEGITLLSDLPWFLTPSRERFRGRKVGLWEVAGRLDQLPQRGELRGTVCSPSLLLAPSCFCRFGARLSNLDKDDFFQRLFVSGIFFSTCLCSSDE